MFHKEQRELVLRLRINTKGVSQLSKNKDLRRLSNEAIELLM